jgi:hypothetical protein
MYWSLDHQQEIDTTQNKLTPTLFTKDSHIKA